MRYLVVIEKGPDFYGAYVPDVPGYFAVGKTKDEVINLVEEGLKFHLESLQEDGEMIPSSVSTDGYVEVNIS
jgi:predicted RNase H-like HicB family nuclease